MSLASTRLTSPPRAAVAFRVGIVGHRPNRLPKDQKTLDALRSMLRCVLEEVQAEVFKFASSDEAKSLYSDKPPVLRAVSPLAEGSDRMFAEEALGLGYKLLCPMPFSQEEFEIDFLPPKTEEDQSRERFRKLLKQAGEDLTKFELDGERSAEAEAYGAAGRVVFTRFGPADRGLGWRQACRRRRHGANSPRGRPLPRPDPLDRCDGANGMATAA